MKKKINLTTALLLIGFVPLIISGLIVVIVSSINISSNLEKITYQKLFVAADGLRQYYEWDIINSGEPAYEHDYVDSLKGEDIELTLFMGDTRFITSALNAQGQRNENTQMDSKIWADVSKGNTYYSDGATISTIKEESDRLCDKKPATYWWQVFYYLFYYSSDHTSKSRSP